MPGPLRRHCVGVLTALLLAATLASCSSDADDAEEADGSSATPSPTASSTPSSSPTPTTRPEPKLPKAPPAKDDEAGQKAFAEFVIDRWGYALATNDASAMTELSPPSGPCGGCPELEAELKKRKKQGWYVDFPGAKITELTVGPSAQPELQPEMRVATASINVPASKSYFKNGELRNENDAHKGATFEVQMRLDGKHYVLLAFRVG
jgi:hypothetical protein